MPSAAKAVSDRLAEHTLADLVHRFEQLSEEYDRAKEALAAGKSLDFHRRQVDMFHSITAGMCLLAAVGKGFIQSLDSAVWNLVDARAQRIGSQASQLSRLQQFWKERADPVSWNIGAQTYEGCYSLSEAAAIYEDAVSPARSEPLDIDARCREAESQIQKLAQLQGELELESELDLTSDIGRFDVINSWIAYVRLELIPNHGSQFRPDWKEQLLPPDFFLAYGAKDSGQTNPTQTMFKEVPGTTKEDRFRHCVSARANIYATACRVIAKMLKAEIERRLSEIGRLPADMRRDESEFAGSWLTAKELEDLTGVNRGIIWRAANKGEITTNRQDGDDKRYSFDSFHEWHKRRANQTE